MLTIKIITINKYGCGHFFNVLILSKSQEANNKYYYSEHLLSKN